MAYTRRRAPARRSYSPARRAPARRAPARRSSPRRGNSSNVMKLVIEMAPGSAVSRPAGPVVEKAPLKRAAKL